VPEGPGGIHLAGIHLVAAPTALTAAAPAALPLELAYAGPTKSKRIHDAVAWAERGGAAGRTAAAQRDPACGREGRGAAAAELRELGLRFFVYLGFSRLTRGRDPNEVNLPIRIDQRKNILGFQFEGQMWV
jgi:hypothetical protein